MADRSKEWIAEIEDQIAKQPTSTWTVAKLKLVLPSIAAQGGLFAIDNVVAMGSCKANATAATWNKQTGRVEVDATFADFRLRGRSHLVGRFKILLQTGKVATGRFHQRYSDRLWPLSGSWEVPFVMETQFGRLIPRPTDEPVVLRSAEPGEFQIPPLGSWFEKWDPISLVAEGAPDGPTLAVCESAAHVMLLAGEGPEVPWLES